MNHDVKFPLLIGAYDVCNALTLLNTLDIQAVWGGSGSNANDPYAVKDDYSPDPDKISGR